LDTHDDLHFLKDGRHFLWASERDDYYHLYRYVHPQNTQAFTDALIKAGKLFDMMIYPMRKHDIGDRDATIHLYRTMLEFEEKPLTLKCYLFRIDSVRKTQCSRTRPGSKKQQAQFFERQRSHSAPPTMALG